MKRKSTMIKKLANTKFVYFIAFIAMRLAPSQQFIGTSLLLLNSRFGATDRLGAGIAEAPAHDRAIMLLVGAPATFPFPCIAPEVIDAAEKLADILRWDRDSNNLIPVI